MAKVIEHVKACYEIQDVEVGKVYRWCPESVVIECDCGETLALTASRTACGGCGADHAAITEEVLDPDGREDKVDHPWRSLHPYYVPTRGTQGAAQEMRAMPSGRRGSSRTRGTSLSVIWCYHNYPTLVTPTEMGRYHARCLACLTVGPERPSSEAARKALQILGAVDSGSEQRTASARA